MTDSVLKVHSSDMSSSLPDRHRSNSYEYQPKRVRKGSISGRLRTASDLEELGFIDKNEKGLIKDLIISGDTRLQALLDKYEQGDGQELLALIKDGYLAVRKPSIELIEGLDFDFINALRDDDDAHNDGGFFAELDGDYPPPSFNSLTQTLPPPPPVPAVKKEGVAGIKKERRASTDDVADLLQSHNRSRLGTLDAFSLHDLIFDDDHPHSSLRLHSQDPLADDHDGLLLPTDADFNDLYQQFSGASQHHQNNHHNATHSNIDLSAYAHHAASLQQDRGGPKLSSNTASGTGKNGQNANYSGSNNKGNNNASNNHLKQKKNQPTTGPPAPTGFTPSSSASLVTAGGQQSKANGPYIPGSGPHSTINGPGYMYTAGSGPDNSGGFVRHPSSSSSPMPHLSGHPNMVNGSQSSGTFPGGYPPHMTASGLMMAPGVLAGGNGMSVTASAQTAAAMRPPGFVGAYSPEQRRQRIEKFLEKRAKRVWSRKVKYDVRKNFADSRLRIKGRFVKKEDEDMMRELMNI